jgi:hypothetical protein
MSSPKALFAARIFRASSHTSCIVEQTSADLVRPHQTSSDLTSPPLIVSFEALDCNTDGDHRYNAYPRGVTHLDLR